MLISKQQQLPDIDGEIQQGRKVQLLEKVFKLFYNAAVS